MSPMAISPVRAAPVGSIAVDVARLIVNIRPIRGIVAVRTISDGSPSDTGGNPADHCAWSPTPSMSHPSRLDDAVGVCRFHYPRVHRSSTRPRGDCDDCCREQCRARSFADEIHMLLPIVAVSIPFTQRAFALAVGESRRTKSCSVVRQTNITSSGSDRGRFQPRTRIVYRSRQRDAHTAPEGRTCYFTNSLS
jgi:hypothetical protein